MSSHVSLIAEESVDYLREAKAVCHFICSTIGVDPISVGNECGDECIVVGPVVVCSIDADVVRGTVCSANQVMAMSCSLLIDSTDELTKSCDLVCIAIKRLEDLCNIGSNTIELISTSADHLCSYRLNGGEWKD